MWQFIFLKLTPGWFVDYKLTFKLYIWLAAKSYSEAQNAKPQEIKQEQSKLTLF